MAFNQSFSQGLASFSRSLDREIDRAIKVYVRKVARGIERDLKAGSPVKTGRMRRGWNVTYKVYPWRGAGSRQLIGYIYINSSVHYAVPAAARVRLIPKVLTKWGASGGRIYSG